MNPLANLAHYIVLVGVISVICTSLKKEEIGEIFLYAFQLFAVFTSVIIGFSVVLQLILWFL